MHIYPGQMYPPLIELRPTEPDYTKSATDIAQCTYTQVRCTPQPHSHIAQCTYTLNRCILANRKTYIFKLQTLLTEHTTPQNI